MGTSWEQTFPQLDRTSAIILAGDVGVVPRHAFFCMAEALLSHLHRNSDPVHHGCVAVPESVHPGALDAETFQNRTQLVNQ
ncbi:hypothetical protein LCGC14_3131360, partial [marine sediment metagenome]